VPCACPQGDHKGTPLLFVITMKNFLRQSNDPEIEAELAETRPFYLFLILVLIFLYGISIYSSSELREPVRFIPFTILYFIHIALHWYMPYLVNQKNRLVLYLAAQILIAFMLILISQQVGIVIGLYMALAGETIGILEDWRRSIIAMAGYLVLMGLTYGFIFGWSDLPGWLGAAVIMLLFVTVYVLLFLRQMNARQESQRLLAELQEAHTQLAEYSQQVEWLTLEAERQRMARELHDTLAQGLAGLVLQLEALEASLERDNTEQAVQIVGQAKERARMTLADARRAIDDLRITSTTAPEAVSQEVARFTSATGIPCVLEMPAKLNVSEQNGEHVVRCVSEGLANVTRHAQATQVWVTIVEDNDRLSIQIRDNGKGFDTNDTVSSGHYGLLGLRERARLAQGELAVESQAGEGTTLRMTIPNNQQLTNNGQRITDNKVVA
jgi:NarL family two-component system sensor histidine kinase YdfH